ncbi:50S ribosomal protein L21 [Anaplasma bovis]|uniref:50S ribosomal protein L21 n=1 Tax=Anaplasma bovis TaxID=186733 RepID=UPI002FF43E05
MFAVIETGGKQYKVKERDTIKVELLGAEAGDKIFLDSLASFGETADSCTFSRKEKAVEAEVIGHLRDKKVIVFKKRRRKNYRRKNGHRQNLAVLRIVGVR